MPQIGKDFGQAAKATAITVNCIAGKTTICGKPYLVSGILIGRYDNGCVGENQAENLKLKTKNDSLKFKGTPSI